LKKNVLVTYDIGEENLERLSRVAKVYASWKMKGKEVETILPEVDVLIVFSWPKLLTDENLARMKKLRFIQSVLVGVNHVPFSKLRKQVVVASNAGAYSLEVGEHAWALLLAAAKKVVEHHARIRKGAKSTREFSGEAEGIMVLNGKTLGIVGYGGIGRSVAVYAKAFGMQVLAFGRSSKSEKGVKLLSGKEGLEALLRQSDVVLLSIPLTNSTHGIIGERELSIMKEKAILVNIARGDLVDQKAVYSRLVAHPGFRYATDVWWFREGQESLESDHPFAKLPNFVGTPHMSGSAGVLSGRPGTFATDNVLRYLKGRAPRNLVDKSEYVRVG
jgi:phosphoglycerate dehydrogenase-like enzyme